MGTSWFYSGLSGIKGEVTSNVERNYHDQHPKNSISPWKKYPDSHKIPGPAAVHFDIKTKLNLQKVGCVVAISLKRINHGKESSSSLEAEFFTTAFVFDK